MSNIVSRNVDDLPESSRQGIEQLLGTQLKAHQRVYIVVDAPPPGPAEPIRLEAAAHIRELIAQAQATAIKQGISDADANAAVEEAMTNVRPPA